MDSRLFIHIGLPKAGSSFLQQQMLPELERQGLLTFLNVQRLYEIVTRIVFQDPFTYDPEEIRKQMAQHLRPGINVLTVEWFSGVIGYKSFNTLETARRLWSTFPDATILLILRNQVDFAYSAYKQHVHQGGALSLEDYFNFRDSKLQYGFTHDNFKFDDHKLYWNGLLYSHLLNSYDSFYAAGALKIFLFESFLQNPQAFAQRMLQELGLTMDLNSLNFSPINTGYGKRQISIARRFNRIVHSPYNQIGLKLIPWFGKYKSLQATHIRRILQSRWSFKLLGNKTIRNKVIDEQIRNYFNKDNALISRYIQSEDQTLFFKHYLHGSESSR